MVCLLWSAIELLLLDLNPQQASKVGRLVLYMTLFVFMKPISVSSKAAALQILALHHGKMVSYGG